MRSSGCFLLRPKGYCYPEEQEGTSYPYPHNQRVDVDTEYGTPVFQKLPWDDV
jgi:hypothetical protein